MRIATACLQCRDAKIRCKTASGSTGCLQCSKRGTACSLVVKQQHDTLPRHNSETLLPSLEDRIQIVDLYLRNVHDKPHTLFHEPTLRRQVAQDALCGKILYALLSLGARFAPKSNVDARRAAFAAESRRLLKEDLEHASLENVQASLLNSEFFVGEGNHEAEAIYFAIAVRMSQYLRLDQQRPKDNAVTRETRLRVWWSTYIVDLWVSSGFDLSRNISSDTLPSLPMAEDAFKLLKPDDPQSSMQQRPVGIWTYICQLSPSFAKINQLHHTLVRGHFQNDKIELLVLEIAADFDHFASNLPTQLQLTHDNLRSHAERGEGQTFVALHLAFFHYSTLLYYHYLDRPRPAPAIDQVFAERCKNYAIALSELIEITMVLSGCEALYVVVGHLTIVSSSVLLHTLLFGNEIQLPQARHHLQINFKKLLELSRFWPVVEKEKDKLFLFQDACLQSLQAHRMDAWMVKFLLNYALPLENRLPDGAESSTVPAWHSTLSERTMETTKALSTLRQQIP